MRIFFGVYNYCQNPTGYVATNKHNFYATFLDGLKNAGHDVLCVDCKWGKNKAIPKTLIEKLEDFDPELCILGNFGFWNIYDYVKCPICFFDIDSINSTSMSTIYNMRNNIERCYFIAQNDQVKQQIKEKFNASDERIIPISLFVRSDVVYEFNCKGNIIYFGDNYVKKGYDFFSKFYMNADDQERQEAEVVFADFKTNPKCSSQELYDKHKFYAYHRLNLSANDTCLDEVYGVDKMKLLARLSCLNLTIKGYGWDLNPINYYPELIQCASDANNYDVDSYSKTLSDYKIALVLNDNPMCKGDNLRLLEAAASCACVVAQKNERNADIINELGLFSFDSIDGAYGLCSHLLKNEDLRLRNIDGVHKQLSLIYNVQNAVNAIDGVFGSSANDNGTLNILSEAELIPKPISVSATESLQSVQKNPVTPISNPKTLKKNSKLKVLVKKIASRMALYFGYDVKNVFPKKNLKIGKFIVYEKLSYTKAIDRIYILSLPIFEVRKKKDGMHLHLAAFTQVWEDVNKLIKYLKNIKTHNDKKKNVAIYKSLRKKIQNGEKIKICLFVSRISCWIYTKLYDYLKGSTIFEPIIVVKPFMFNGHDAMVEYMKTTYETLKSRGYNVVKGYDESTGEFLDVRKTVNPDIVFYTKYWLPQFQENFYINKFEDKLTFYTSYCFDIAYHPECMNFELNNKVDRYFMPTPIHKEMAKVAMTNHAQNVYVVGAPKLDVFFDKTYIPKDVWKPQEKRKKRIIWAPHHSDNFPGNLYQFNSFYELTDFMFEMAEKYKDDIQIAFKPHPMLKPYLVNKKWGRESADAYYNKWATLDNGQLETGEFIDLFLTSDAMILDSISFIAEYTATNKPSLFTIGSTSRVKLNDFGAINFEVLYHTNNNLKADIEKFIVDVVINGNDYKKDERTEFINKYLLPPNGKSAAENIYDNILDEIKNGDKKKK